jgi:hypothetical protein
MNFKTWLYLKFFKDTVIRKSNPEQTRINNSE